MMRWNPSAAIRHPPNGCTCLWSRSCRKGRLPKASLRPSRPSGHASLPAPQGRVSDFAQVLDPATTAQLNALVAEVEQRTTAEIAVVVVPTTAPLTPKEYVTALFNH